MSRTSMATHNKTAKGTRAQAEGLPRMELSDVKTEQVLGVPGVPTEFEYENDLFRVVLYAEHFPEGATPPPFILIERK